MFFALLVIRCVHIRNLFSTLFITLQNQWNYNDLSKMIVTMSLDKNSVASMGVSNQFIFDIIRIKAIGKRWIQQE